MIEQKGKELIDCYKRNYKINIETKITEEMIIAHWELEKNLTKELLESNSENRWETFERCYNTLYKEIWWLNQFTGSNSKIPLSYRYQNWINLVGSPPKKIYEVGSGKGEMISYLASLDFECKATEISHERGEKFCPKQFNLKWGISDGIHLQKFESPNSYDVVISNQVIEHLHPDDLCQHFKGVLSILSKGGKYIFITPHRYKGPSDISRVFKCDRAMGMHLKEYTYLELKELLKISGFKKIKAIFRIPAKINYFLGYNFKPKSSYLYLIYLCMIEKLISFLPSQTIKRKAVMISILFF